MALLEAWINPLRFIEVEVVADGAARPSPEAFLRYLVTPGEDATAEALVKRYREVVPDFPVLALAPVERSFLEKLVWPLRNAIVSYTLGNYLGSIALAGMVGEMLAILIWEYSKLPSPGRPSGPMNEADQEGLFGRTFERLDQSRRASVLRSGGLCDEATKRAFDELRTIRNRHLHAWSYPHEQAMADARRAVTLACEVVRYVTDQSIDNGTVRLRPELMAYLSERRVAADESARPGEGR